MPLPYCQHGTGGHPLSFTNENEATLGKCTRAHTLIQGESEKEMRTLHKMD